MKRLYNYSAYIFDTRIRFVKRKLWLQQTQWKSFEAVLSTNNLHHAIENKKPRKSIIYKVYKVPGTGFLNDDY